MFLYVYYSKGNGCHESADDVALIKAWTRKQAEKLLKKHVELDKLNHYDLYRLKWKYCYKRKVFFISDY